MWSPVITTSKAAIRSIVIAVIGVVALIIMPVVQGIPILDSFNLNEETIVIVLMSALGFAWRWVQNWLKHRDR